MQLSMAARALLLALAAAGAGARRPGVGAAGRRWASGGAPEAGPEDPARAVPGAAVAAALRPDGEGEPHDEGLDGDGADLQGQLEDAAEQERQQLDRLGQIHRELPRKLERDFRALKNTFMPGYRGFTTAELTGNAWIIFMGLSLIALYVRYCFDPDRTDDTMLFSQPAEGAQMADGMEEGASTEVEPDIIVVLHHPNHPYDDKDKVVKPSTIKEALVHKDDHPDGDADSKERDGFQLRHIREALDDSRTAAASAAHSLRRQLSRALPRALSHEHSPEESGLPPVRRVTYGQARIALLKDLYDDADRLGWNVKAFSSIDKDEIYVCMSLRSWPVAEKMLQQHRYSLQVQTSVVKALGIAQPAEEPESSPPYLRYDVRTLTGLKNNQVEGLDHGDRSKFYRVYYDIAGGSKGEVFNSKDRIRLMFKSISSELDLDTAEHAGLIVGWYPAHNRRWTDELKKQWTGSHKWLDFSFEQPVAVLRNYYGSRVAYTIAWVGHFTKLLVPLAATAVLLELFFLGSYLFMDASAVQDTRRKSTMGFSFVVVVWARVAGNLWSRQEAFLQELFELDPSEQQDQAIRPSFIGEMKQSNVDLNIKEKQSDQKRDTYVRFCSGALSVMFCCIVFACIVAWIELFSGNMGMMASAGLSLQIVCFSLLFEVLCKSLTEWENHKHQSSYYDSYLWKHCLLNMVNNYTAFFYLSIKQKVREGTCPPTGCLHALQTQIMSTLCILNVAFIAKSVVEHFVVQVKIWLEERQARELLGEDEELTPICWAEMQSKLPAFRLEKQVVNDVELVVALGFPILFASIAPAIAPFCLIFFAIRLRMLGKVLTQLCKRPLPRRQFDTSAKATTIKGLMRGGMLFSAITLVLYNPVFDESGPLVKLSNVVVYYVLMEAVVGVVDLLVPTVCTEAKILAARRRYVEQEIRRRSAARGDQGWSLSELQKSFSRQEQLRQTLEREEWDKVQPFPQASTPMG